jgi:hypothetical protein
MPWPHNHSIQFLPARSRERSFLLRCRILPWRAQN